MTCPPPDKMVHSFDAPVIGFFALVLALVLCSSPCLAAGYLYLDTAEQPILSAHAQGDTRYYPGDSFTMTVILNNKGRDTAVQVEPLLSPGAYDPSTALGVTVRPRVADAPVTLKSLPMVAGDIGSWDQVPITLKGTVDQNATPGAYQIPLEVTYQYVYAIPMVGPDFNTINMLYREKQQTLPVTLRVMSDLRPAILNESSENLVPGTQGYLTVDVMNAGYATGTEVSLRIVPADNVTFQMVDDGVYLGRFGPGDVATVRARIAIQEHTGAGSYPATLTGQYRDTDGIFRTTREVPLGIMVSKGAVIDVVSKNLTIGPGGEETITVSYLNTGDTPAYNAEARIIGNQVLLPVTGTASLGCINPHEIKTAQFVLSATTAIAGKRYVIDTDVKYRDGLDALMLSDTISFGVDIKQPAGLNAIISNPVILIILAGVIAILLYGAWKLYKRPS